MAAPRPTGWTKTTRTGIPAPAPARPGDDAGLIAYEMAVLVKRVGQHMVANPRFPANHTTSG